MPNLTGSISFDVEFNFTIAGAPFLALTALTTIPGADQPNLIGHFIVTQPDGLTITGEPASVTWNGTGYDTYDFLLTLCSDNTYEKGTYTIVFVAFCTGYIYGQFSRSWDMEYKPVTLALTDGFDVFIPLLLYSDLINYQVGGYDIEAETSLWEVTSPAGDITGTDPALLFTIGGNYYDSTYLINYAKTVNYRHTSFTWLTVAERLTKRVTKKATIPPTMATMLTYLINVKNMRDAALGSCNPFEELDRIFSKAEGLYQFMRTRVCAQNTAGLGVSFDQFYNLTHNYQPFVYINTNGIIPAYDFTTGCGGSGSGGTGGAVYAGYYTALTDNETVVVLAIPVGARIITVQKGINPLLPTEFSYAEPIMTLTGIALATGESLFITYALTG